MRNIRNIRKIPRLPDVPLLFLRILRILFLKVKSKKYGRSPLKVQPDCPADQGAYFAVRDRVCFPLECDFKDEVWPQPYPLSRQANKAPALHGRAGWRRGRRSRPISHILPYGQIGIWERLKERGKNGFRERSDGGGEIKKCRLGN